METPSNDLRIQRMLDGLLSPEEEARFKQEVVSDTSLRSAYVEQLWLHSTLRAHGDQLLDVFEEQASATSPMVAARTWPRAARVALAMAACVTAVACVFAFGKGSLFARPVATLVQAENCQWAGSDLPTAVNSKLGAGRLALVEGIATLRFKNGATVVMEAPTTLDIYDAMHCRLIEGTVTAEVPEPAHGFAIDTPDIKVVDLGTKFGVTASTTGNSQVRVFEGEVVINGLASGEIKHLTTGRGLQVGSGNTSAGQEPTRGEQVKESGGWTAIPTSFGRGKDAFVRRSFHDTAGGKSPLLIVKHTELEHGIKNERRALISFDVSLANASKIQEAQLILDPEPSGFGFSALVPDSRFAVYGITDESLDAWEENEVRWETLPGCTDAGPVTAQTKKLAEFWMPRGGAGTPLTIRSDDLAQFIRFDTNGVVSLLIIRETGETDPSGLAHAFASKEHPTARPPTLRLK
jgi:FecR protein